MNAEQFTLCALIIFPAFYIAFWLLFETIDWCRNDVRRVYGDGKFKQKEP